MILLETHAINKHNKYEKHNKSRTSCQENSFNGIDKHIKTGVKYKL